MKKTSTEIMEDDLRLQDIEINTLKDLNLSLITRLREAERDAARINHLTSLDDEEFFSLMSDTRMMPEQFRKVIDEAMKESA